MDARYRAAARGPVRDASSGTCSIDAPDASAVIAAFRRRDKRISQAWIGKQIRRFIDAKTIALVSGGFDLSVGSVFAAGGVTVAVAMAAGYPEWLAILIALAVAGGWGLLNGFAITKIGVNPLLTTLTTMGMARGYVFILTDVDYPSA